MKKWINTIFAIIAMVMCLAMSSLAHARAIFNIAPNSSSSINIPSASSTFITYTVTNNTNKTTFSNITIDINYGVHNNNVLALSIQNNTCAGISLPVGSTCTFGVLVQGIGKSGHVTLRPRVCGFRGAVCSVPTQNNQVTINAGKVTNLRAYITDDSSVSVCTVDPNTGTLSNCIQTVILGGPTGITFNPSMTMAYVALVVGSLDVCAIDQSNGTLTNCTDSGVGSTFNIPEGIAINKTGTIVYVSNDGDNTISLCTVNQTTGGFSSCTNSGASFSGVGIILNSAGTQAYLSNNATVDLCTVNQTTGGLSGCSNSGGTGFSGAIRTVFNNAGGLSYSTNSSGNTVSKCNVSPSTGKLSGCIDSGAGAVFNSPQGIVINPAGTLAYVTNNGNNTVSLCMINSMSGDLSNCVDSGASGFVGAFDIVLTFNFS